MQASISVASLGALQPRDKPFEVRDARLKGLLVRVQPSGVMTYYVEYGRGKRIKLGRADVLSPSKARDRARGVLADAFQGKDPKRQRDQRAAHSLGAFIDEVYDPWAKANLRTAAATVARLKRSFRRLLKRRLDEITPWRIEKWRIKRLSGGVKASTVNRDLDDLKSALAKAKTWGFLKRHALRDVKRQKVDSKRPVRFLQDEEEIRLRAALDRREARIRRDRDSANKWREARGYPLLRDLKACAFADHLKPLVLLSLNTGLRRGELFSLTWRDVDVPRAFLTVRGEEAKDAETRHVDLNAEALAILAGWRAQWGESGGLVFPGPNGSKLDNVNTSWRALLKEAAISNFRWHDLRHTFASNLAMQGVNLNTIRELLGHSDYQMTLRYAHLSTQHRADAVEKLVRMPRIKDAA